MSLDNERLESIGVGKGKETRVVTYTCRYSSGQLISDLVPFLKIAYFEYFTLQVC